MNYQKIYNQIIERGRLRTNLEGYSERHHIVPRCMDGDDSKENLVRLTAREHFICHWLLARIYPSSRKLVHAFWFMCNVRDKNQQRYTPPSHIYSEAKEMYSRAGTSEETRQRMRKPKTEETKQKIREKRKLQIMSPRSEETKKRQRESALSRPPISEETREKHRKREQSEGKRKKIGDAHRGKTISENQIQRIIQSNKARGCSEETRRRMRESWEKRRLLRLAS